MKKYLLMPGYINSQHDNDEHYISPVQLKNLYNVPMSECIIHNPARGSAGLEDLIVLKPQFDGNYTLPQDKESDE